MTSTALSARNVSVSFDGLKALANVVLDIPPRRVTGLIGPNGAGKTTLVNVLTGFQAPTAGRILLGGASTVGWSPERFRHRGVARTFQAGRLFKALTVVENVEVTGNGMGLSRRQAHRLALELLAWIGMADKADTVAGALPYTDERRVGIARALLLGPAFLLLDEPAQILAQAVRRFLETACQAFEPTHSKIPISVSWSRPMILADSSSPRFEPATRTGAKPLLWPFSLFSISTVWRVPTRLVSQFVRRSSAA